MLTRLRTLLLALCLPCLLLNSSSLAAQVTVDGVILDRANAYDGYPVHLLIDGVHKIWFCSQSPETDHDGIYYSEKTGDLSTTTGWSTPIELFNITDIPWAVSGGGVNVCDPTIIRGDFTYNATSYSYALYFTADTTALQTGDNAVGVAFSNDGINWTIHGSPVITPDGGYDGTYGAGASGVAWGPVPGRVYQLFRDSTAGFGNWRIRYKESTDGLNFTPTPSLDTPMSEASASDRGDAPELAFFAPDSHWYAALNTTGGGDPLTCRALRSHAQDDIFSTWATIDGFSGSITGDEVALLPSLARNENSSLYVDPDGYIFIFYTTGNLAQNPPGIYNWKIIQARYKLFNGDSKVTVDTFTELGQNRKNGDVLAGTNPEVGGSVWAGSTSFILSGDAVTPDTSFTDSRFALVPIDTTGDATTTVEAKLNASGSAWSAIGLSSGTNQGLFGGEIWLLLNPNTQTVTVFADGQTHTLTSVSAPNFSTGYNIAEITYTPATNTVQASLNRVPLFSTPFDLDTLSFTPTINAAGFHIRQPTAGTTKVDDFYVNKFHEIFSDGFEGGDLSDWMVVNDQ